jgi:hypothetical protein
MQSYWSLKRLVYIVTIRLYWDTTLDLMTQASNYKKRRPVVIYVNVEGISTSYQFLGLFFYVLTTHRLYDIECQDSRGIWIENDVEIFHGQCWGTIPYFPGGTEDNHKGQLSQDFKPLGRNMNWETQWARDVGLKWEQLPFVTSLTLYLRPRIYQSRCQITKQTANLLYTAWPIQVQGMSVWLGMGQWMSQRLGEDKC